MPLSRSAKKNRNGYAYLYILPALGYLCIVLFVPLFFSIIASFFRWDLIGNTEREFIGLKNYIDIFRDKEALNSLLVTAKFLVLSVFFEMIVGYLVALFLNIPFRFNRLVRVITVIPMMLSPTIVALMWKMILNSDRGVMNYLLERFFGIDGIVWLGPEMAMITLVLVDLWLNMPFVALMLLAGLQGISTDVIEAAKVDGANAFQRCFLITTPLLKPIILVALVFRTTFNIREFPLPWIFTAGGPANMTNVYGIELYRQAFSYYHIGYSSALSWLLIIVTFGLSVAYTRMTLGKDKQ